MPSSRPGSPRSTSPGPRAVADTIATEAGVEVAVLDPLEGITDASAAQDYLGVMRANLETLREGQQCR